MSNKIKDLTNISDKILWKTNTLPKGTEEFKTDLVSFLGGESMRISKTFHESFPQYEATPLVELKNLAKDIGVKDIFVKDESYRFGLNAFKVLGGSFAMAKYLAKLLDMDIADLPYDKLISDEIREKLGPITFVTATDGNHGRGVAWTANQLKQHSIVYMPFGSSITRLNAILAENSDATVTDVNYDECVRMADRYVKASKDPAVVVQDTAWEGYEEIPAWIMQGYGTMALEAMEQLKAKGVDMPTHVIVQAGVGSLAGAVQGVFAAAYGDNGPKVAVLEANLADCLYESAIENSGKVLSVGGEMQTLMAGLACGEANITGWEIMKNFTTVFVSAPDWVSANGMRILAAPKKGDTQVVSGESGAATTGLLYEIMINDEYKQLREDYKLDENSVVLLFSTEGDTDPAIYEEVVWRGKNKK